MLWLWHRPAAAAPIQLLARELPYATGIVLKKKKKKKHNGTKPPVLIIQIQELPGRSSHLGSEEMNLTSIHEDTGWVPGLSQCVKDLA